MKKIKKSYYYNKYINEIVEGIKNGEHELNFHDGDCEIIIKMYYESSTETINHKSPRPYELPGEAETITTFKDIVVEIETFEDFYLPDFKVRYIKDIR